MPAFSSDQLLSIARQHFEAGRNSPAEDLCRIVLREHPDRIDARELLARARRAAEPADPIAHYNHANQLFDDDRLHEAIAEYRCAIAIKPDFAEAHSNLGNALSAVCETDHAIAAYETATRLRPDLIQPRWNRALSALLVGDFERGWEGYELRFKNFTAPKRLMPQWNGENLSGKTILLWAEQGLGDTIQFVRYFRRVEALANHVVIEVPPEFRRLLVGSDSGAPESHETIAPDFHCSLLSLPRVFRTRAESIPGEVPYLHVPLSVVERWRTRLGGPLRKMRVGLVWAGRSAHQHDRKRSIPLAALAPLTQIAGIEFHSLQKEGIATGSNITDHATELSDFAETAALIENMDLVISVDTAVAHLAGALAKPTWLLLAFAPDWRWQLERTDSPWYPTMRLFRQRRLNDWSEPITRAARELLRKV